MRGRIGEGGLPVTLVSHPSQFLLRAVALNGGPILRTRQMKAKDPKNRKDYQPIKVYCFPDERQTIEQQARSTGLSKSSYLLRVGMGYPIRSIVDHHKVEELVKINGDLGRLGGLLKLWLSNGKPAPEIDARTIRETLRKIDRTQDQMLALMQRVLRPQADPMTSSGTTPDRSTQKDDSP